MQFKRATLYRPRKRTDQAKAEEKGYLDPHPREGANITASTAALYSPMAPAPGRGSPAPEQIKQTWKGWI